MIRAKQILRMSALVSGLGMVLLMVSSVKLEAQTLFKWPDNNTDVSHYKYFDKCLAASGRMQDSLYRKSTILMDTLRWREQASILTTPKLVVEIAERCIGNMDYDSVASEQYWIALELYLLTKKYDIAEQMVNYRFSSIAERDVLHRAWFLDSVITRYAGARPRMLDEAGKYVEKVAEVRDSIPKLLYLRGNWTLFQTADSIRDSSKIEVYGKRILDIISGIDKSKLNSNEKTVISMITIAVTRKLFHSELLDSLRKGTSTYVSTIKEFIEGVLQQSFNTPMGEKLPHLEGDFWFPSKAVNISFPRKGKVSLIYFLNVQETATPRELSRYAVLRRLEERFPELDIITVSGTRGYFGLLEPPTPGTEANVIHDLVSNLYRIPGILTVTDRPTIRIADPDGRVLSQVIPNAVNYPGDSQDAKFGRYFLVDEEGLLISSEGLSVFEEDVLVDFIDVLIERVGKKGSKS